MDGEEAVLDLEVGGDAAGGGGTDEVIPSDVADGGEADSDGAEREAADSDGPVPADGRYGSKEFKADYDKIKAIDPAAAKAFQRAYWKVAGVDKLGTTQELTALKEAVELHGGVESLSQMAEEVAAGRTLEEGFQRGDKSVIEGWAKDYPDGFKKLVLPALEKLAQIDPAYHEIATSTVSTRFLENYGVFDAIGQLGEALKAQKPEDAIRLYNDLVGKVFQPMRALAQKGNESPNKERESALDQREQQITESEKKAFYGSVRTEVNTNTGREMNKEIAKLMRGKKFSSSEQGNRVRGQITEELKRLVSSTPDYGKRYEAVMGQRDRDKAIAFISSNATRQMSKAVQAVLKDFNLLGGNGAARPVGKPAPKGITNNTVAGRPAISDVDFSKTDKATYLGSRSHGTAWLKSGKQAKW